MKAQIAVSNENAPGLNTDKLREGCRGVVPLPGRLADWMPPLLCKERLHQWVDHYGSPLNIVNPEPFLTHAAALSQVASERGLSFRPFFARKANKCLAFVDAAADARLGIDCASSQEIQQSLARGVSPDDIICTAAVKDANLLKLCIAAGVTIAIDNFQELTAVDSLLWEENASVELALRMSGFIHRGDKLHSRFGFDIDQFDELLSFLREHPSSWRSIAGLHFHLDGYCASQRVSAIQQLLPLVDVLRRAGESVSFLDIGGGLPVCYLANEADWVSFWLEHERALTGKRGEITFRNDPLGRFVHGEEVMGEPRVYPFYQQLTREDWFAAILDTEIDGTCIARQVSSRGLKMQCQPGRSLLDDAGLTVARVEGVKPLGGDDIAVQLAMNGTQCRTSSVDFCIDPLLVERRDTDLPFSPPGEETGYLFGAYCTESDLIIKRRLEFPKGIGVGDLIVLPNTAGYFMHFLESRSHQFSLAKNLVYDPASPEVPHLDEIDESGSESAL
ncbi:type III PLP-dependent enzyme domain-containing protein [Adhaeretor mobilis]|uniref:Diaminopimelate decarboxylase n=1 Tax=Adhaeretor mobilis TaxID=1930276 RepID=A0A517MX53_9BACT|nr:Y4yA family PLP-dependent enzyme [Adhaeretor mobilis]QDS99460.1 Diaminopimelate decarboxylase [Adhaeretor mobilis]